MRPRPALLALPCPPVAAFRLSDSPRTVSFDVPFAVPFVHRLRFTTDLFGRDQQALADVLERSGSQPARVQFWVDEHLGKSHPELKTRLHAFVRAHGDQLMMPGNIQTVPGGEAVKNDIEILQRMLKCIHAADLDRRSYIVVIGGGAVLDAVGVAAAVSHRGIRLVRIPTTTLAQADSGVGVKNSVNLFGKKNWCGTFAVPWAVINDAALLDSLPDRDFVCGFSEAVKVSLLKSPEIFSRLCRDADRIRQRDMDAAWPMIQLSGKLHLDHITRGGDPFEMREARPLDFGHWSAHKLEALSDFELRHGEAVAIGVAVDTVYSSLVHGLPTADAQRVLDCLRRLGVPLDHPSLHATDRLFAGLEEFRQHLGGRLTVTMLRAVGDPLDVHEVDRDRMLDAIDTVSAFARRHAVTGVHRGL
jgi:3-dehydroquinate synthase